MFENLSDRLQNVMHKIKGYGRITEDNISEMMREIRLSLLEADVNYNVVKEFTNNVKEKALGADVNSKLSPGEEFVKIVRDELTELLGGDSVPLEVDKHPTITMLVGLQGSGKTTTIGKLANFLRKNHKKRPLLVACDVYRPAAIDQLRQIGKELNIEVYSEGKKDPVEITKNALNYGIVNGGGMSYIKAQSKLKKFLNSIKDKDTFLGAKIVFDCLDTPLTQIISNCGLDTTKAINHIKNNLKSNPNYCFDALTNKYCSNCFSKGIIDATIVPITSLKNAVSVVATIISTVAVI